MKHRRPPSAAIGITRSIGTSIVRLCADHGVTRSVYYRAQRNVPWARRYLVERLGYELTRALLGGEP